MHLLKLISSFMIKAAFPRAKFLCHISHVLQSLLTYFCGIITVNLYSRTDTDGHAIFGKEKLVVYLNLKNVSIAK